jgi:hypothetical protein
MARLAQTLSVIVNEIEKVVLRERHDVVENS